MVRTPYWVAARTAALALQNWQAFDGALALNGVDPERLAPGRVLNAFLVWLEGKASRTEEGQQRWRQIVDWINEAPASPAATASAPAVSRPGILPAGAPVSAEEQAAAFAAFEGFAG